MKVKITVTESFCRSGYHKKGDVFIVEDICPEMCMELWHEAYPYVFALRSGAILDYGEGKARKFSSSCPDGGRVKIIGEVTEE